MSIQLEMKNLTLAKTDTELLEMLQNNIQCIYDKFVSEKNDSIDSFHKEVQFHTKFLHQQPNDFQKHYRDLYKAY